MTTKVKGLIKGLRYISQIFDEEKEAEIQIGFPTDVKHVAHIGWDGPSAAADNPTWMQGFNGALKSAPLGPPADSKDDPEIKWVSEDTRGRGGRSGSREAAEGQKSSGRHPSSGENDGGSPRSSKPRQSRRHKSAADGTKSPATASDSAAQDVAKKSRRKKSKDFTADSCSRSSRTCRSAAAPAASPDADQGPSPQAQVQEQLENC